MEITHTAPAAPATPPSRAAALSRALASRRSETKELREQYGRITADLAASPASLHLIDDIIAVEAKLATAGAAITALEAAAEAAAAEEAAAEAASRRAAARERVAGLVDRVKASAPAYEALQAASDAFLAALQGLHDLGQPIGLEASQVLVDLLGLQRAGDAGFVVQAAAGLTDTVARALAHHVQAAIDVVGRPRADPYVAVNSMAQNRFISFTEAGEINTQTVLDRLEARP